MRKSARPEYRVWADIVQRCFNKKNSSYKNYGGRGISMDPMWRLDFMNFILYMGNRPSPQHTIHRIDNDGHYMPGNCKWVLRSEQGDNKRNSQQITYKGETHSAAEWCRRLGLDYRMVQQRFGKLKWDAEKCLELPKQPRILNLKGGAK